MSYSLAVQLADEWEYKVREYKKTHKKGITHGLMRLIEADAFKSGMAPNGTWNERDVANKACEILAGRIGENF